MNDELLERCTQAQRAADTLLAHCLRAMRERHDREVSPRIAGAGWQDLLRGVGTGSRMVTPTTPDVPFEMPYAPVTVNSGPAALQGAGRDEPRATVGNDD